MAHPLNEEWLKDMGWKKVDGGWLPIELNEEDGHTPISLETALRMTKDWERANG